ncbi:MAG: hypothetical protein M1548_07470 [Actinobacteria bacterium]|nr:hypothetical protein [Actinomycetota bacterium]
MLTWITLVPSGFSAGVVAAVAAGVSAILLLPFLVVLIKLIKRTGGFGRFSWKATLSAMIIILLAVGLSEITSLPSFCRSCHAMRPVVASWAKGEHKIIGCLSCHREKGFGGITIRKLEDVRMLLTAIAGSEPRGLNKPIRDEICLGCHADITRRLSSESRVRVSHREFAGQGITCTDCHADTSHGKAGQSRAVVMERCSTCHNGKRVSADCSTCHSKNIDKKTKPPESSGIGHGNRWLELHGVKNQGICTACHEPEDCTRCHLEMPHPDGWSLQHGREALGNKNACLKCHVAGRSCDNCHRLTLPHRTGWLKGHVEDAKRRGDKVCLRCHLDRDCASCHGDHKNLPQVKKVKARAK